MDQSTVQKRRYAFERLNWHALIVAHPMPWSVDSAAEGYAVCDRYGKPFQPFKTVQQCELYIAWNYGIAERVKRGN